MAFTHLGMAHEAFLAQQFTTNQPVTDIGFCTETLDARRIAGIDADIMKHGCLFEKLGIEFQFRVLTGDEQTAVGHLPAMR